MSITRGFSFTNFAVGFWPPLVLAGQNLIQFWQELVKTKQCGPILVRLSWHDAGVFSDGRLKGGCPNAVMRFTDAGEGGSCGFS